MVQSRVYDYGSTLTQARTKTLASRLFAPGVYDGMDPVVVSSALLQLTAGCFLLPNGVLVVESTNVDITPPTPASATDYTLTADHDDIQATGGSSVTYTWRTGILARTGSPNANSLALLWLRHPGASSVTLAMLSVPPDVRTGGGVEAIEDLSGWLQAPFSHLCDATLGANITATGASHSSGAQHLGVQVSNSAGVGLQNYQFRIPLPAVPYARFIDVYAIIPNLGSISFTTGGFSIVAEDGTAVASTPTIINGPILDLSVPAGTLALASTATQPVTLGVTVSVPALTTGIFLKGFRVRGD